MWQRGILFGVGASTPETGIKFIWFEFLREILKEIAQKEKITILVNRGRWNEEKFFYQRGEKEKMGEILGLFKK